MFFTELVVDVRAAAMPLPPLKLMLLLKNRSDPLDSEGALSCCGEPLKNLEEKRRIENNFVAIVGSSAGCAESSIGDAVGVKFVSTEMLRRTFDILTIDAWRNELAKRVGRK